MDHVLFRFWKIVHSFFFWRKSFTPTLTCKNFTWLLIVEMLFFLHILFRIRLQRLLTKVFRLGFSWTIFITFWKLTPLWESLHCKHISGAIVQCLLLYNLVLLRFTIHIFVNDNIVLIWHNVRLYWIWRWVKGLGLKSPYVTRPKRFIYKP